MNRERINLIMQTLLVISISAIIVGGIFKVQHWAHGNVILWCGIWSNIILSYIEINRLRTIITKSETTEHSIELSE